MKIKFRINGIPVYRKIDEDTKERTYYLYEEDSYQIIITNGLQSEFDDWKIIVEFIASEVKSHIESLTRVDEYFTTVIGRKPYNETESDKSKKH